MKARIQALIQESTSPTAKTPAANSERSADFKPGLVTKSDGANLRFVEEKQIDLMAIAELTQACQEANHWSNFGPISQQLEKAVADKLDLADDLRVVMCSSGTAAMHALINMHESIAGKKLRWVTSAFGFYTTVQGPLADADIVDCNENAMLDLDNLDPNSFDGFIVTNIFGQEAELDKYYRYAAAHGKIMCVDSALSFASHEHGANECISFHHTKPWGFGEAGCAIVAAEHEALFRSMISFGHTPGGEINRRATNGKISEVSCAFAMVRLKQMDIQAENYRRQYKRIASIAQEVGFSVLANVDEHPGVPASVPLQAPKAFADFKHDILPTGRYYHPLTPNSPKAYEIYDRMLNVPCHVGLASLSDEEIRDALQTIISRSTAQH